MPRTPASIWSHVRRGLDDLAKAKAPIGPNHSSVSRRSMRHKASVMAGPADLVLQPVSVCAVAVALQDRAEGRTNVPEGVEPHPAEPPSN